MSTTNQAKDRKCKPAKRQHLKPKAQTRTLKRSFRKLTIWAKLGDVAQKNSTSILLLFPFPVLISPLAKNSTDHIEANDCWSQPGLGLD